MPLTPGLAPEALEGPGTWRAVVPGRSLALTVEVPGGFIARARPGWLVELTHGASRSTLRVGFGALPASRQGFIQVFADAGDYRSGPGGTLAATESWVATDPVGPTLVVLVSSDPVGLFTELEVPIHAELTAWEAFGPVVADLRLE